MKLSTFHLLPLCLLILFACQYPTNKLSTDSPNWMSQAFPDGTQRLTQIIIPGTHDSATFNMNEDSEYATDYDMVKSKQIVLAWSKTQSFGSTISKQLSDGIRYFDLRIEKNQDGYFSFHGLRDTNFNEIANDFDTFSQNHPDEIIIIDFQALEMSDNEAKDLELFIEENTQILTRAANLQELPPNSTIRSFRDAGKNIIILWDKLSENPLFNYRPYYISSPWANSPSGDEVKNFLLANTHSIDNSKFYVHQLVVTPDASKIACGWLATDSSLYNLTRKEIFPLIPTLIHEIKTSAARDNNSPNIFIIDFYDQQEYIKACTE
ncbi:MAG: hypothetical protein JXR63_12385 [Spirochaetales bacterium]|nr:hypothetical protein [Spirochaetales bacterium]